MERRRESRLSIELPGTYRTSQCEARAMFFSQLSSKGCRLVAEQLAVALGERVLLFLGPIGPIDATVRWLNGATAGVEFDSALDAVLVEYFAAFIIEAA